MKHKIIVTGGLGFIGSHVVVELQNEGFEVLRCLFQGYLDLKAANEKTTPDLGNFLIK